MGIHGAPFTTTTTSTTTTSNSSSDHNVPPTDDVESSVNSSSFQEVQTDEPTKSQSSSMNPPEHDASTPQTPQPRASNPIRYQKEFLEIFPNMPTFLDTRKKPPPNKRQKPLEPTKSWGAHLIEKGVRVSKEPWVHIADIPPVSSLEAMMQGVQEAIEDEMRNGGIIDVDKAFIRGTKPPLLTEDMFPTTTSQFEFPHKYIREAKLILSPFARPTGWFVRLANRSLAQALLLRDRRKVVLKISSSPVRVKEYKIDKGMPPFPNFDPWISDAVVRVENCSPKTSTVDLMNVFSRFDLTMEKESIVPWRNVTPDGKSAPFRTFLIYFADASWARAAMRERQGVHICTTPVRLVQYPRQLLV